MQNTGTSRSSPPVTGFLLLGVALAPAVAALVALPGFVTSDGPAHLYNAQILSDLLAGGASYGDTYQIRWAPLPNWGQYLLLIGLTKVFPARVADRISIALTLAAFAAALLWLRWKVAGARGLPIAAVLSALLAMNVPWLFGFTSFLMGAALFPVVLGVWWAGRDALGPRRALVLGTLLLLGYFCHPVSLGLTAGGLLVLAVATPGPRPGRRLGWTLASLSPLVPLGLLYGRLMRSGGGLSPQWPQLTSVLSVRAWLGQLGWADPLTLGSRRIAPFVEPHRVGFVVLNPGVWAAVALLAFALFTWNRRDPVRRGWGWLAALLLAAGFLGPDVLGQHGGFLTSRVALLGLAALLPWLELEAPGRLPRLATGAAVGALALQSAFVWDYGWRTQADVNALLARRPEVGTGQRVAVLVLEPYGRYRSAPRLHLDCLLGLGTGNVVWNNYETAHYFFPVQVRAEVPHPPATVFETFAMEDTPEDAAARRRTLGTLLDRYHDTIDRLVVWGSEPDLERLLGRWFEPGSTGGGPIRVFQAREPSAAVH